MPIISVVVPVYNGEKTIAETIQSVLSQTFKDFEILIINDGSTDQTLKEIQQFCDNRLQVFTYPNQGVSASRNRGITLAKGEYISFIDADDLWTCEKLESQLQALIAQPTAEVAYSWTDFLDEEGKFLHKGIHATYSGNVYANLLTNFFLENGSNPLIRKRVFDQIGVFDESLKGAEDWDLFIRIASRYEFVVVQTVQVLYRQPTQSASTNVIRQEADSITVIHRAFAQAPPELQALKQQSLANLYQYLTFRAIAHTPSRRNAQLAIQFLAKSLWYNPQLWKKRFRLLGIILVKSLLALLLPHLLPISDREIH